jgi:hypothetical protein
MKRVQLSKRGKPELKIKFLGQSNLNLKLGQKMKKRPTLTK